MPSRELPARPDLDQLRRQAKGLRKAFAAGDQEAVVRVHAVLSPKGELKLTDAQLVVAREYGFSSWAKLRAHVHTSRGVGGAVEAFHNAVLAGDRGLALAAVESGPRIASERLSVAAALGDEVRVRSLLAEASLDEALVFLCYSPFHGESLERDAGLVSSARALLEAGADPNAAGGGMHTLPVLYAVTGHRDVPAVAELLLEAGANPTDGESVFHAAERMHVEALDLLLHHGVDLNRTGEWGNTPLYFLLRYWNLDQSPPEVGQGVRWLLDHGADPNVLCGTEQETSLHVSARRGQPREVVRLLLEHGADVNARRGDGRTAWALTRRGGFDELAALLEEAGASVEDLLPVDRLLAACGRGDPDGARELSSPTLLESLEAEELRLLPEAAARGGAGVVDACLAAGFPVDAADEQGATALHHAAIRGDAELVRSLLAHGADFTIRDPEHRSGPLGWAVFGADHVAQPEGDYAATVRALLEAGSRLEPGEEVPADPEVLAVLREHGR